VTINVRIPAPLRSCTGGADELAIEGQTVREVLDRLVASCSGLGERVLAGDGKLRPFVNVYVGRQDVRSLQGLDTPVKDGDVVSIVPAVAGGRSERRSP
jgi:molybdopterin synthase sulfur carrier subunit